ncbi:hypothetical protein V9T40_012695 [Parthenolecanium corni]|uniref:Uncharacterized protein n=1 Tax=Parthenolecanium corni TaxID=536013 RepID=A0AAN9XZN6_9HEMI
MVTVNNVCKRFESKSVMSDSYVQKYVRARKRAAKTPKKCLFGPPTQQQTEEFASQTQAENEDNREATLKKYDLDQVPAEFLEASTSSGSAAGAVASTSGAAVTSSTTEGVVFQPRIVSDLSPAPSENVFTPIEKVGSSSSSSSSSSPSSSEETDTTSSEYWQTSKRRRASSKQQTESEILDPDYAATEKKSKD